MKISALAALGLRAGAAALAVCAILNTAALLLGGLLPPGPLVAFMGKPTQRGSWDIYLLDVSRRLAAPLTHSLSDERYPSWSPDGTHIAYHSNGRGTYDLYIMNADGSQPHPLSVSVRSQAFNEAMPQWSPDGQYIGFHSNIGGYYNLYVTDPAGQMLFQVTDSRGDDVRLSWSPDGTRVVFASARGDDNVRGVGGLLNIYIMTVADLFSGTRSGELLSIRLTETPEDDWYPSWSPDSQWIVFTSHRDYNWEIYVMDAQGGSVRNLTNTPDRDETQAVWLPDGSGIVYAVEFDGQSDLYVMDPDGGNPRPLTATRRFWEQAPSWRP